MNKWLISLGLVLSSMVSPALNAQKLELLTEKLPPINMSKSDKNYAKGDDVEGIAPELIRSMCKKAGIECEITLKFPWDRIYKSALERNGYGLFSASRTAERESLFQWVGPLTEVKWVVLKLPSSSVSASSIDDLKALKVGGYKGDAVTTFLQGKGVTVDAAFEDKQNVGKLKKGQIDVWATGSLSGPYFAKQEGVSGLQEVMTLKKNELWLALNKQIDPSIVEKLNKALADIKKSPEYDAIHSKYR